MTTATKLRPILFSSPMVRAILDGRKTQTRRIVKWPNRADVLEPMDDNYLMEPEGDGTGYWPYQKRSKLNGCIDEIPLTCPYGQPGDVLWVRETWQPFFRDGFIYLADAGTFRMNATSEEDAKHKWPGWKPSIHMPRAACRLWIEVVSVRAERVQDITAADCVAEGIELPPIPVPAGTNPIDALKRADGDAHHMKAKAWAGGFDAGNCQLVRVHFSELWDSINGKGAWERNDWVWRVEFKRTEKP